MKVLIVDTTRCRTIHCWNQVRNAAASSRSSTLTREARRRRFIILVWTNTSHARQSESKVVLTCTSFNQLMADRYY